MTSSKQRAAYALNLTLGALALSGCLAGEWPDPTTSDADAPGDGEPEAAIEVAQQKQALVDVKSVLCKVIDAVPSTSWGNVTIKDPQCELEENKRTYYFGSGGPGDYSSTVSTATYCAIADTGSKTASAVFNVLGGFGSRSVFRTYERNNQTRHVAAEHLGEVTVFGLSVPLQYTQSVWDFSSEFQPGGQSLPAAEKTSQRVQLVDPAMFVTKDIPYTQVSTAQTGHYGKLNGWNLHHWGIGGSGWFMAGPVKIDIDMDIKSDEPLDYYDNARFAPGSADWAGYDLAQAKFDACMRTCNPNQLLTCSALCGGFPSTAQRQGHELSCAGGCGDDYFSNTSDGVLPYTGPYGGTRANIIYGDPIDNFWQMGFPGTPGLASFGETQYTLLTKGPKFGRSFYFGLGIKAGYDLSIAAIEVGTDLTFETRTGAALRSRLIRDGDLGGASGDRGEVYMDVDAETAVNLNAWLHLHVPLPWPLEDFDFRASYDILDRGGNGHKLRSVAGAKVSWSAKHEGTNNAPTAACTAFTTPVAADPQPPATKMVDFVHQVGEKSIEQLHPCNVKVCVPNSASSELGKFTYYTWDSANRKLVAQPSQVSCSRCDSTAALCDAQNNVMVPLDDSSSCNNTSQCSGSMACDTDDDCPHSNAGCYSGCCTTVK